jgi:hypothetical protein
LFPKTGLQYTGVALYSLNDGPATCAGQIQAKCEAAISQQTGSPLRNGAARTGHSKNDEVSATTCSDVFEVIILSVR